ncbi:TetR/AcrR family transcriptional regulator [Odoribacter sp. OttesenSCG-928-L07]|nr:TetR/AcrR family transcriptional regulator [Odoribacter sp. OttesenSCG-928-L07]MDL2239470.1 TetR/AcrR family transcriptional regulator [Bacteroidales bacterium OttesenSCG-928-L14]MDL2240689.1 TetR/AcrR family transcriptional regulator [Bacteroidales bacterium OttesenSCG-928-K22]
MTVRDKIITTATEMFLKFGLRSVSIDDICNELRISKKTFYSYFNQKEELIEEILESMRCGHLKVIKKKTKTDDNANCIDKILKGASYFNENHHEKFGSFFFDLQKFYPDILQKHTNDADVQMYEIVKTNLIEGINDNLFRKEIDIEAMAIFLTTLKGKAVDNLKQIRKFTAQQAIDFLIDSYMRILVNENGLKYYLEAKKSKEKVK